MIDDEVSAMRDNLQKTLDACLRWPGIDRGTYVQYMDMAVSLVQLRNKIDYFFHVRSQYVPHGQEHVHVKER